MSLQKCITFCCAAFVVKLIIEPIDDRIDKPTGWEKASH